MLFAGEKKLKENMGMPIDPEIVKISDRVYFFNYFGSSNATLILADNSAILVDAFVDDYYAAEAKKEMAKITDKPLKTLIYTHQHVDHIAGAGVFTATVETVIAHSLMSETYGKTELIANALQARSGRQFGFALSVEESISTGMSRAEESKGKIKPLTANHYIESARETMIIDGIEIVFIAALGETDDQQYIYLPQEKIVCCGDNYYSSWPNLYAIRGSQYRDISQWVNSLDVLLGLDSDVVLPGHGKALIGKEKINEMISPYREAINYVLEDTLKYINQGLTPDEIVNTLKLPAHLAELPQLVEYYGTIEWSIRGIYSGYLGWFDGNPTHLGTMNVKEKAEKFIKMMGGADNVWQEIQTAITNKEMQWACELCDILLDAQIMIEQVKQAKSQCLVYLGRMQTSANGRHYYLSVAKELVK